MLCSLFYFFFFQAEDGIRDVAVTGVQTCALPIYPARVAALPKLGHTFAPLVEATVRLRPDVVLMAYSAPVIAQLERFGIPVLALDANDMAQLEQVLHKLDQLLQVQRANALLARSER